MKIYLIIIITLVTLCPLLSMGQETMDLGNKRELFVDHHLIDKLDGVSLQMHHPHDEGPVLYYDKPWEGAFSMGSTIIKDNDIYRFYYLGRPSVELEKDGATPEQVFCYAQSHDGIHWEKPDLKIYEYHGSLDNNILMKEHLSLFVDTKPNTPPEQRYKGFFTIQEKGLYAYISSDGIHWKKLQEEPLITKGAFDGGNIPFWSESEQCYVCYFRTWSGGNFVGFRTISRSTSPDFLHWTEPVAMTFGDTPMEHLYTNQTAPYFRAPHIYINIGARFMDKRRVVTEEQAGELNVHPEYYGDCSDAYLASSRGGNVYDRTFMESFIRPGIGMENWVSRTNYPALNVVQTGPAEMSVYVNSNYAQPTAHLRRYSLRLDGFASLAAPYKGGEVITKFFTFSGSELEINYSTSAAGEIRFEIQDENSQPVPGFTLEDSQTIIGNEIARIVRWNSDKNLKELAGKKVRLRIVMKDADLYSLRFIE